MADATTKSDLIKYFSGLDIAVLQKLKKYSEFLIIPDENLLTNVTMQQMIEEAHRIADEVFPQWTDRSKSDFGEFLVELFSVFSEKDFWYINAHANESIFRKMRSYSNAFSKASSLGYYPTLCKGSTALFNVTFAGGDEVTYGRGELTISVGDKTFSNDEEFTLPVSAAPTAQTLTLHEGEQVAEDITYNGHNIFLRKKNIDIDSIAVTINNVLYERVRNFGESNAASRHFLVLPEADGSCSIYFGSDGFGSQPTIGQIIYVEYRTCDGSNGDTVIPTEEGEVSVQDSLSDREATAVAMLSDAEGGQDAESLTSIKEKASSVSTMLQAAFNEASAEKILNTYPFVKRSNIVVMGTEIIYQAIPATGTGTGGTQDQLTNAERNYLQQNFEPCLMLGYYGTFTENTFVDFVTVAGENTREEGETRVGTSITLNVIVSAGTNINAVEKGIRQMLTDMTNPMIDANYGDAFSKATTELNMRARISGIQSIAFFVNFDNGTSEVIEDFAIGNTQIFKQINQAKVTINVSAI